MIISICIFNCELVSTVLKVYMLWRSWNILEKIHLKSPEVVQNLSDESRRVLKYSKVVMSSQK